MQVRAVGFEPSSFSLHALFELHYPCILRGDDEDFNLLLIAK